MPRPTPYRTFAVTAFAVTLTSLNTHAASFIWDGDRTSNNWNSTGSSFPFVTNWTADFAMIPGALDTVQFDGTANDFVVDLNGNRTVLSATFAGGSGYTLDDNTLTLSTGNLTATDSATHTINSNVTIGAAGTWDIDATLELTGSLGGAFDLTKSGTGTLVLSGDNAGYTNDITVAAGTLEAGSGLSSLSDATNVQVDSGATLHITSSDSWGGISGEGNLIADGLIVIGKNNQSTTFSGVISGVGSMIQDGTGTLTLSGTNTFSGGVVRIDAGAVSIDQDANLGDATNEVRLNGGKLIVTVAHETNRNFQLFDATSTIETDAIYGISGDIFGTGGLEKTGAGDLVLFGNNTYGGNTRVTAGNLVIFNSNEHIPNGSPVRIQPGAKLALNNATETIEGLQNAAGTIDLSNGGTLQLMPTAFRNFPGNITGTANTTFAILGGSTQNLGGASPDFFGTARIDGSNFRLNNTNAFQNATVQINVNNGLNITTNTIDANIGGLEGPGNLNIGSQTLTVGANNRNTTYSGAISGTGSVIKNGTGTLTLSTATSAIDNLHVDSGTLTVDNDATVTIADQTSFETSTSTLTINDATYQTGSLMGVSGDAGTINISDPISGTALTIGTDDSSTTFNGQIHDASGGPGSLLKTGTGTLRLNGSSSYTGGTTFGNGILDLGHSNALGTGTLTVQSSNINYDDGINIPNAAVLENALTMNVDTGAATHSGVISESGGSFGITKTGPGTLTLSGTNAYSGGTTLVDGTIAITESDSLGPDDTLLTIQGGVLQTDNTSSIFLTHPIVTSGADAVINVNDGSIRLHRDVSGDGGLVKNGPKDLIIQNLKKTYSGSTTINAGRVQIQGINKLPDDTDLIINGGQLVLAFSSAETVGSLSGSGGVRFVNSGNHLTVGQNNSDTVFSGFLEGDSGNGALTKTGTGTLTLTGDNDYGEGTTLSGGKLVLEHNNAAGTGDITITGSTLSYGNGVNIANNIDLQNDATLEVTTDAATQSGVIGETGGSFGITKTGSGTLALTNTNTHSGGTHINAGTLITNADANFGDPSGPISLDDATLRFNASFNLAPTRLLTINEGGGIFNTQGQNITIDSTLGGTGTLTKPSTGTLNLTGTGSSIGSLIVTSGNLNINSPGDLTLTDPGTVIHANTNSNININAPITTTEVNTTIKAENNADLTIAGTSTTVAAKNLVVDTNATTTIENQATATFTGNVTVGSNSFIEIIPAHLTIQSGASFTADSTGTFISGNFTVTGSGTSAAFGSLDVGSPASGQTTTIENGADVTVSGHTSLFVTDFSINNATFSTGTITNTFGAPTINITDPAGGIALTVGTNDGTGSFGGNIADTTDGPGSLQKVGTGTLTLTKSNTYSGGTILNGGAIFLDNSNALGSGIITAQGGTLRYNNTLNVDNNVILENNLTFAVNGTNAATHSGLISESGGSFGINKTGTGTLTLTKPNTFTGANTIDGGTLVLATNNALGTGDLTVLGSTIEYANGIDVTNNIILENDLTTTVNGTDAATQSGTISESGGSYGITKSGSGSLTLASANTHSGTTLISDGSIILGDPNTLAASTVDIQTENGLNINALDANLGGLNGGPFSLNIGSQTVTTGLNNSSTTFLGNITGTANSSLQHDGTGTLLLAAGTSSFGALALPESGVKGTVHLDDSDITLTRNDGPFLYALDIDGSFIAEDTATVTFTAADSYAVVRDDGSSIVLKHAGTSLSGDTWLDVRGGSSITVQDGASANLKNVIIGAEIGSPANLNVLSGSSFIISQDLLLSELDGTGVASVSGVWSILDAGNLTLGGTSGGTGTMTVDNDAAATVTGSTFFRTSTSSLTVDQATFSTGTLNHAGTASPTISISNPVILPPIIAGDTSTSLATDVALVIGTNNGDSKFDGVIQDASGLGTLKKTGTGTLTLSGANTYSGGTLIDGGTVAVSADTNLGNPTGPVDLDGGTLQFNAQFDLANTRTVRFRPAGGTIDTNSFDTTISQAIIGSGGLTKQGPGTLTLQGANVYPVGTNINGGTLAISSDANLGVADNPLQFDGGALRFNASFDINNMRSVTLNPGGGTIDTNGFNTTISSTISGSGDLTKNGLGTLTVTSDNPHLGDTVINAGTLQLGDGGTTGIISLTKDVTNHGTLIYNRSNDLTWDPEIGGTGSLIKEGPGTLTLTDTSDYTGGTTINAGILRIGEGGSPGSIEGDVINHGAFAIARTGTYTFSGSISGSGILIQQGPGTFNPTGNNTYDGDTEVTGGILLLNDITANAIPDTSAVAIQTGATLHLDGVTERIGGLKVSNGAILLDNGATLEVHLDTQRAFGGTFTGAPDTSLVVSGINRLNLNGANPDFFGTTTINSSQIKLNSPDVLQSSTVNIQVDNGLDIISSNVDANLGGLAGTGNLSIGAQTLSVGANNNDTIYAGVLSGTGGTLVIDGTGTLTLTAANSYNGGTGIFGGTLLANNTTGSATGPGSISISFGGVLGGTGSVDGEVSANPGTTVAPGASTGQLTINNNMNFQVGSNLAIEIDDPTTGPTADPDPGIDHDQLVITGNALLNGTLAVTPLPDEDTIDDTPLGTEFHVMTYGSRTNMFDAITGTLLSTSFALAPHFTDTDASGDDDTLILRALIPGDLNGDLAVSVADLSTFALNFNTTPGLYDEITDTNSWQLGDFNTDGAITVADLSLLALNFGIDASDPTSAPIGLTIEAAAALVGIAPSSVPEPNTLGVLALAGIVLTRRTRS